jgi:hypothetical protein
MCVCVCVCVYIYIVNCLHSSSIKRRANACTHARTHTHKQTNASARTYTHLHTHTHRHTRCCALVNIFLEKGKWAESTYLKNNVKLLFCTVDESSTINIEEETSAKKKKNCYRNICVTDVTHVLYKNCFLQFMALFKSRNVEQNFVLPSYQGATSYVGDSCFCSCPKFVSL